MYNVIVDLGRIQKFVQGEGSVSVWGPKTPWKSFSDRGEGADLPQPPPSNKPLSYTILCPTSLQKCGIIYCIKNCQWHC